MKTLYEKIITLYPGIKTEDNRLNGVVLRNDSDDRGDYIETWDNTEYTQPTQEELDAVE
jgi:hypothetical protein